MGFIDSDRTVQINQLSITGTFRPTMVQLMVVEEQLKNFTNKNLPLHAMPKHWAVLMAFKCTSTVLCTVENNDDTWMLWRAEFGPEKNASPGDIITGKSVS